MSVEQTLGPGPGYAKHPGHGVELNCEGKRVQVVFNGETIADSRDSITVYESNYDPVYYLPRSDVRSDVLTATNRETHCPFKGYASYWSITVGDKTAENAVWGYDRSYDETAELRGRVAFYGKLVDRIEVSDGDS